MGVSPARRAAFDILLRVETEGAFSDELLHSARTESLDERDRALVFELVLGCLRRQGELDDWIARLSRRGPGQLDVEVRVALRLGCYQLGFLSRVPAHAAVSESVELVRRARKRSAAGLVNAVLRARGCRAARRSGIPGAVASRVALSALEGTFWGGSVEGVRGGEPRNTEDLFAIEPPPSFRRND